MSLKTCSRCGESKPTSEYYKHPQTRDRLAPHCKACDNKRSRKATGTKINRMRARHRAVADLIAFHEDEFVVLLSIRLAEAKEEAEALAATPEAIEHYQSEPVRLKPGQRMMGQSARDRIDVARCPDCIKHHDRGHVCAACGASPTRRPDPKMLPAEKGCGCAPTMPTVRTPDGWVCQGCGWGQSKQVPSGVRRPTEVDLGALEEFNAGTRRAAAAR